MRQGRVVMTCDEQLVSDIWSVIHMIEGATKKEDLSSMGRAQLERLVRDVYDKLGAIIM